MAQYTRPTVAFALAAATLAAACGDNRRTEAALSQDSALARDLSLAQKADSVRQPQLQDVPATSPPVTAPMTPEPAPVPPPEPAVAPAPRASAPAPRPTTTTASRSTAAPRTTRHEAHVPPPPPRPAPVAAADAGAGADPSATRAGRAAAERGGVGSIPSGAVLSLGSNRRVCTNTNQVGDRFTATLNEAVTGTGGATIPAGATATVEITQLHRSENMNDKIQMGFRVVSVSYGGRTYAVAATTESADVTRVRNQPSVKDRQKVIGGAVVGAIAGRILGGGTKGTVIGAATGAAAGAGVAAATANYEGCLNEGAGLRVRLTDAVQVRLASS